MKPIYILSLPFKESWGRWNPKPCPHPSVYDKINILPESDRILVSDFSDKSPVMIKWLSPTTNPMDLNERIPNINYTDGHRVWGNKTVLLAQRHFMKLPKIFLEHVKSIDDLDVWFEHVDIRDARMRYPTTNSKNETSENGITVTFDD